MPRLYAGNLPRDLTGADLRVVFGAYGMVTEAHVVHDRASGDSRGFGFVEMPRSPDAEAAIRGLDGSAMKGRKIVVSRAHGHAPGAGATAPAARGWAVVGEGRHRW